jgi:hypothetical protein
VTAATREPLRDRATTKGYNKSRICRERVRLEAAETGEIFGDNKLGRNAER